MRTLLAGGRGGRGGGGGRTGGGNTVEEVSEEGRPCGDYINGCHYRHSSQLGIMSALLTQKRVQNSKYRVNIFRLSAVREYYCNQTHS